eukprot:scaffold114082_cov19-Tisochrysis_lutea.AAC.2
MWRFTAPDAPLSNVQGDRSVDAAAPQGGMSPLDRLQQVRALSQLYCCSIGAWLGLYVLLPLTFVLVAGHVGPLNACLGPLCLAPLKSCGD